MFDTYTISIDLNKIYNQNSSESESISQYIQTNSYNLTDLVRTYNNIDSFNFTNLFETYQDDLINKFNIDTTNDLVLFDKYRLIKSYYPDPTKYKSYANGLILFDTSMLSDAELYSNIDYLYTNYKKLILNKFDNNYVIYFSGLISDSIEPSVERSAIRSETDSVERSAIRSHNSAQLENNIKSVFEADLRNLLLYSKIRNIPSVFNNSNIQKKIGIDLEYANNIKSNIFNYFYTNQTKSQTNQSKSHTEYANYEQILKEDLSSDNYKVKYSINTTSNKQVSTNSFRKALNRLSSYNEYINNISDEINQNMKSNLGSDQISNTTSKSNTDLIKTIKVDDLFNLNKINDIYNLIKSSNKYNNSEIYLEMNDVRSKHIGISLNQKQNQFDPNPSSEQFKNNIIMFLNELIKKKMVKIIREYNYMNNKNHIDL